MPKGKKPGPQRWDFEKLVCPAETPGPLGFNDRADPNRFSFAGDTPGALGRNDYSESACFPIEPVCSPGDENTDNAISSETSVSGSVAVGAGAVSVVRIPVLGSNSLFVELKPRGFVPKSGSTSSLFIQDTTGNRHLRLDYGYNKTTGKVDYHWNQKGTHADFGITDHTQAGKGGKALHKGAKYLKYGGKVLLVVGVAADVYSIVVAKKKSAADR